MKKNLCLLLSFILCFFLCLSLFSCSKSDGKGETVTVTVTFYKNDRIVFDNGVPVKYLLISGGVYKTQTVAQGEYMSPPPDPTILHDGLYFFGGWYKEPACENAFDFNSEPINTNINLYAKWIKKYD